MNLHEYQAKQVFASYGMPVPNNQVVKATAGVSVRRAGIVRLI
ncbi:MAG: hypothetical protein ACC650_01515 [Gammaproteobacteria bacterium]